MRYSKEYLEGFEAARERAISIAGKNGQRCRDDLDPQGEVAIRWITVDLIKMRPELIEPREA